MRFGCVFRRGGVSLLLVLLLAGVASTAVADQSKRLPVNKGEIALSFAAVVKQTAPAVVNVYSRRVVREKRSPFFDDPLFRRFFGEDAFGPQRKKVQRSLGSGVVVEPSGIVVTNHHVIKNGNEIKVAFADGREFEADVILRDKRTDLAVLRLRADGARFTYLQFGNSDLLEVGDLVLAIGNPFGVGQTVTSGIISALARARGGISDYQFFIQTDAAINPGNSGGALISMDGRLVGINTAIYTRSGGSNGIGFAIPVNMVRAVVESAKTGNRVRRPWVGAKLQRVTPEIAESLGLKRPVGLLVGSVYPRGPAARAGLRSSDVIISASGHEIRSKQGFNYYLATKKMGQVIELEVLRGGKVRTAKMKLVAAPEIPPRRERVLRGDHPFSGAKVANLSPAMAEDLSLGEGAYSGVVVTGILRGSSAHRLRLKRGDIIEIINDYKIRNIGDLSRVLRSDSYPWSITVRRGKKRLSTVING